MTGLSDYRQSALLHSADDTLRVFPIRVLRVDYEKVSLSVISMADNNTHDDVTMFPSAASSMATTDMQMPEVNQVGLAVYSSFDGGFAQVAVLTWVHSNQPSKLDAVAHRAMAEEPDDVEGFSVRYRGVHRKPYPGQRSATRSLGLHQFEGAGWDQLAADLSQDRLDTDRRERTQTTGRAVTYTDAGLSFVGPVNRPGADPQVLPKEQLPDGSTRQVAYLADGKVARDRYFGGGSDVVPWTEVLSKVQEFSLDYPVPYEALESGLLDTILGTTADPWARSLLAVQNGVGADDQTFLATQAVDHPTDLSSDSTPVGPSLGEGNSPRRRGWMIENVAGTLVGYNSWDAPTYGRVLKPVLWPLTKNTRFGTDVETGHLPVVTSKDHVESRLASTAWMMRFPAEYNTTRFQVTKEGQVHLELGATLPHENIPLDATKELGGSAYEHPWGAGRSLEAHLVGSAKLVIGKNRDEEDSLDLTTLGQVVLRLGADDGSLPNVGRNVLTQIRGSKDAHLARTLQYWSNPALTPGDAQSLDAGMKKGAENVSLRAALDGGTFLRLGARNPNSKRRHLINGYKTGQGYEQDVPGTGTGARSAGRPTYGAGDSNYQFHDLTTAGSPLTGLQPYFWSGDPVGNPDVHGLSFDLHAVRDIFLRVGKNQLSGQSILIDLDGGIVGIVGQDKAGRSLAASMLGGIELTIGSSANGQAINLDILGDVKMVVQGNYDVYATGDITFNAEGNINTNAHKSIINKSVRHHNLALTQHVTECGDIVAQQGSVNISAGGEAGSLSPQDLAFRNS